MAKATLIYTKLWEFKFNVIRDLLKKVNRAIIVQSKLISFWYISNIKVLLLKTTE